MDEWRDGVKREEREMPPWVDIPFLVIPSQLGRSKVSPWMDRAPGQHTPYSGRIEIVLTSP